MPDLSETRTLRLAGLEMARHGPDQTMGCHEIFPPENLESTVDVELIYTLVPLILPSQLLLCVSVHFSGQRAFPFWLNVDISARFPGSNVVTA